jgi:AcrR family transcriptional regulator
VAHVPAAERRNDLVRAAVTVIASHGVDGATTRRIAAEARAPLAALHYCFHSKEVLFAAVYEELSRVLRDDVLVSGHDENDVTDAAVGLLRRTMEWYLRETDFSAAAVELILWARRQQGDMAVQVYDEAFAAIREALHGAAADGYVSPDVLASVPPMIAAIADGFVLNWLTYGDPAAARREIDVAAQVLETWLTSSMPDAGTGRRAS